MPIVFKVSYRPPPLEVLNQLTQLPPIPLPISPPNLIITRRLIFRSIPSTSFSPTSSPTTFSITVTSMKPTWNQLCDKIRSQFNIPASVNFGLTYTNSESEEIAFSSQKELDNYYSQHQNENLSKSLDSLDLENNPSYKFDLNIFPPEEENKNENGRLNDEYNDEYYDDDYDDEEYMHDRGGCSQQ